VVVHLGELVVVVDVAYRHLNQMDYFLQDVALFVEDVALQFRMDYFHQVLLVVLEY
jgi:hypothetical protein